MVYIYNKTIVKKCAVNKIEFNEASLRLKCEMNKDVPNYICLPNSDRTALFEFCFQGKALGLQLAEHCPYIHNDGQLNSINCSDFVKGCPNHHYNSYEVYKYPACLEINREEGCYKADPKCSSTFENGNGSVKHLTSIYLVFIFGVAFAIAAISLVFIGLWILKKRNRNDGSVEGGQQTIPLMDHQKETNGTKTLPDSALTAKLPFDMLLTDIVNQLSAEKIQYIRDTMSGYIAGKMNMSDMEFFKKIADRFHLQYNILYLQAILTRASKDSGGCDELVTKCVKFAENSSDVLFLERDNRPPVNGFNDIKVHIKGKVLNRKEMERVRRELALILEMDSKYVLYRGGEETQSFLLKIMVLEENIIKLKDKKVIYSSELIEIGVDFIISGQREIKVQLPVSERSPKADEIDPWKASRAPNADHEPAAQTRFSSPVNASMSRISKDARQSYKEGAEKSVKRTASLSTSGDRNSKKSRTRKGSI